MDDHQWLASFFDGSLPLAGFDHRAHVRLAFLLLRDRPLPETMIALREGLKNLARRAGRPEKYHETMTFALAAIVAERMAQRPDQSFGDFAEGNPDLMEWGDGAILAGRYSPERLQGPIAQQQFLLP